MKESPAIVCTIEAKTRILEYIPVELELPPLEYQKLNGKLIVEEIEAFLRFLNINVPKSYDDLFDKWSKEIEKAQLDSAYNDFNHLVDQDIKLNCLLLHTDYFGAKALTLS